MVPPAVCWSGQLVALLDKIECSFNGVERQPGLRRRPHGADIGAGIWQRLVDAIKQASG